MPPRIPVNRPAEYETFAAPALGGGGRYVATLPDGQPGLQGYLVPFWTLSDRGTFFTPGAFKKTVQERLSTAHHLYFHWSDLIIGKHTAAEEDATGLRVTVLLNEEVELAREVMSNYRFGIGYGWSIGFDPIRDRSGSEDDDAKLDRSGVPELKNVPITELRAIEEARWWEGSTVPWGAIHSARPDTVHSRAADPLANLLVALKDGTATDDDLAAAQALADALTTRAAAGSDHGTRDDGADRTAAVRAALARHAVIRSRELAA